MIDGAQGLWRQKENAVAPNTENVKSANNSERDRNNVEFMYSVVYSWDNVVWPFSDTNDLIKIWGASYLVIRGERWVCRILK